MKAKIKRYVIGFTGTQEGMTIPQHEMVYALLLKLKPKEVHHGDCVGADQQFHDICIDELNLQFHIHIHPPTIGHKRAFCITKGCIYPVKSYLERNQDIVDSSDVLIATPKEAIEQTRSGTWSTIRKARKKGILVYVINPSGAIT